MGSKLLKQQPGFNCKGLRRNSKHGFADNSKPNYKAKGSAIKLTSHRRGKV